MFSEVAEIARVALTRFKHSFVKFDFLILLSYLPFIYLILIREIHVLELRWI